MVIAFVDQNTCKVLTSASEAPQGAIVFSSPAELSCATSASSLDSIRRRLLGYPAPGSASSLEAAAKLWHLLALGYKEIKYSRMGDLRVMNKLGSQKRFSTNIELLKLAYVSGADHMSDYFYKTLSAQLKTILQFFVDDAREIWTSEEATQLVLDRGAEFTRAEPLVIWERCRPTLIAKGFLKKVTFKEYIASPEFSSLPLHPRD